MSSHSLTLQEENFYIIGNTEELIITINGTEVNPNVIPSNEGRVNNTGVIAISPKTIKQNEIQIKVSKGSPTGQSEILAPGDIGTCGVEGETRQKFARIRNVLGNKSGKKIYIIRRMSILKAILITRNKVAINLRSAQDLRVYREGLTVKE